MAYSPGNSPLTPAPETPYPTRGRQLSRERRESSLPPSGRLPSLLPRLGALGSRRPTTPSAIPVPSGSRRATFPNTPSPGSVPSGFSLLKDATSAKMSAGSAPSQTGSAASVAIQLNSPDSQRAEPRATSSTEDKGKGKERSGSPEADAAAVARIRDIDDQFSHKDYTMPQGFESLENRLALYASKSRLEPEDVADYGAHEPAERRFKLQPDLLEDVCATMDEVEALLLSLRLFDPERIHKPSWRADPTNALKSIFSGARSLAILNAAWMGFSGRFSVVPKVYAKYLARAYDACHASVGEVPSSPISTSPSVYRAAEQYEDPHQGVKYLLGSWPHLSDRPNVEPNGSKGLSRDRFVELEDEVLCPVPEALREAYPLGKDLPRLPEEGGRAVNSTTPLAGASSYRNPEGFQLPSAEEEEQRRREHKASRPQVAFEDTPRGGYHYGGGDSPFTPMPGARRHLERRKSAYEIFGGRDGGDTPWGKGPPEDGQDRNEGSRASKRPSGFFGVANLPADSREERASPIQPSLARKPSELPPFIPAGARGIGGFGGFGGGAFGRGALPPTSNTTQPVTAAGQPTSIPPVPPSSFLGGGGGGGGGPPPPPGPFSGAGWPNPPAGPPGGSGGGAPGFHSAGAGGGPPGDPGNDPYALARGTLFIPYGTQAPTIPTTLKSSKVPAWNGDRSSAIAYLWNITELERGGGYLSQALGYWLWQRLEEGSSVQLWYMTLEDRTKDWMQFNARNWILGIVYGFLGRRWLSQLATEFKQQSFREGAKHRRETPHDFINRRILLSRLLGYSQAGSREEVELLTERLPAHWHHMLSTTTILSTDELKNRALEFEEELLAEGRRDHPSDLEGAVAAALKRMGVYPRPRAARPNFSKPVAYDAEALSVVDEEEASGGEPSEEEDALEEVIAAAYQVVQQRTSSKPVSYPFKARNDVKTTAKKLPPSPCRACGSPNHWNRECPHNEEFLKRRKKEGFLVEDAERDRAYNAAYAMLTSSESDFEGAASDDEASSGERKTHTEEEMLTEIGEEKESASVVGEVLHVNTSAISARIEVIDEEYWHAGGALPWDHPHILEFVGAEAQHAYQPDQPTSENGVEGGEAFAIPDVLPYDDVPVRLRSRLKRPPGYASLGTSVLSVRGWLGSMANPEMDLRLDSCASLSLLSAECYDSLLDPPPIKQGAKMKLWQLTATSEPMRGYVQLPVYVAASDGTILEMEVETYVVEGMTVPLLLGEDFQQAYETAVERRIDGTNVYFGQYPAPIPATPVERTKDFNKVAKSYCGEVPSQPFVRKAHRNRLRRERRKREARAQEEDTLVRSAADLVIRPQCVANIPLMGPFSEEGEWIIEKNLLSTHDDQYFAVPNTLVSSEIPFAPIANLSHAPRWVRKGEIVGRIAKASEFFDTPGSAEERERMLDHAKFIKSACELNLGGRQPTDGHPWQPTPTKLAPRATRMADSSTYDAWKAGQRPAKRKFFMPDKAAYPAWAQGEEQEQEDYGPKTAAMPETEDVKSEEFRKVLDVGALPEHLKEKAWAMLERHQGAFALDGRLGEHEAAARIRTKEGVNPIAVPMFGASPAK
ncbi:hypothetical protein K525DRAFT_212787, partial [Schizophyllum commune Loenen D]